MKLNYRDKVILGIVLAIAIVVAGYFALIKPKNEQIKTDTDQLDSLEVTEKEYKQRIAQIEPLKTTINEIVSETGKVTEKFVDKEKIANPVLLDQFMQHFANENEIKLKSVAVGDMSEGTLDYYYIQQQDIGSGLRSLADINGDYQKEVDKRMAESNQLSNKEATSVLISQYGIEATGTKENLWKLMDAIEKYDDAIIINSVSFTRVKSDDDKDEDEDEAKVLEPEDELDIQIVISLYSVYDLPQVKVDDVQ